MSVQHEAEAGATDPWRAFLQFDPSRLMSGKGMAAFAEAQQHMIGRVAALNHEVARFVDRRLTHDQETVRKLAECGSPQEAMAVWTAFVETASRHYAEEMGMLAGLGVEQAREAAQDVQREIEETSEDLTDARKTR
ncbi:MAG: phasin family protein [Pseudomonadota bacterium]